MIIFAQTHVEPPVYENLLPAAPLNHTSTEQAKIGVENPLIMHMKLSQVNTLIQTHTHTLAMKANVSVCVHCMTCGPASAKLHNI